MAAVMDLDLNCSPSSPEPAAQEDFKREHTLRDQVKDLHRLYWAQKNLTDVPFWKQFDDVLYVRHSLHGSHTVKVQTWVNDRESDEFVGVGARFGPTIDSKEKHVNRTSLLLADPFDCCTPPREKVAGDVLLVQRGVCKFTMKAKVAEAASASAIIIMNHLHELYKMVCDQNETDLDINIPEVLLPKDAGSALQGLLARGKVSVRLYSPDRPLVDTAEVFLWLMAISTILCAAYWSSWSA